MTPIIGFPPRDSSTAVGVAADRIGDLEARHGTVGTRVAPMAGSPSVLTGYLDLSRAVKRTKLPRSITERLAVGLRDRDVLDIVALVVLNVLTGTFDLLAGLEPAASFPDDMEKAR